MGRSGALCRRELSRCPTTPSGLAPYSDLIQVERTVAPLMVRTAFARHSAYDSILMSLRFTSPTSALLLLALLPLAACKGTQKGGSAPPVPVRLGAVEQRDLPLILQATGTVEPIRMAEIQAQVTGTVLRVGFQEGDLVREGQVLFQLDPRPYAAAVGQRRAVLARDLAQLTNARRERERMEQLAQQNYATTQELDQAKAGESALMATLQADSASLEAAQLDLQYATIRAPFSGRAGAVLVREGNLARGGSGQPLVVLNQVTPVSVRFAVPATYLARLRASQAGGALPVRALPVGDSVSITNGTLAFLDNAVDTLTGTVALKATFPNKDERLWPGGLVRVALELATERGVLVVPRAAVITGQQGASLFVVTAENRAALRRVSVLRSDDSLAVVRGEVQRGDRVVTDGQLRLTDGAAVTEVKPTGEVP